jgi:hypothetical protein
LWEMYLSVFERMDIKVCAMGCVCEIFMGGIKWGGGGNLA